MKANTVLKKNPNIVTRDIGGETVLVPVIKTSDDINCIYTLNKAASEVWKMLDGKRTVEQNKKAILKKFDTNPQEAEKKLQELLQDLKKIKAVII